MLMCRGMLPHIELFGLLRGGGGRELGILQVYLTLSYLILIIQVVVILTLSEVADALKALIGALGRLPLVVIGWDQHG